MEVLAGPDSLAVVPYMKSLAEAKMKLGKSRAAARLYERAIAIVERVSGSGHSDLAPFLLGLSAATETHGARANEIAEGRDR
jgi:hypothetical protein